MRTKIVNNGNAVCFRFLLKCDGIGLPDLGRKTDPAFSVTVDLYRVSVAVPDGGRLDTETGDAAFEAIPGNDGNCGGDSIHPFCGDHKVAPGKEKRWIPPAKPLPLEHIP